MRKDVSEIKEVLDKHKFSIDSIIAVIMKEFNIKSICWRVGAKKEAGYSVTEVIALLIMLPLMLLKSIRSFYHSNYTNITSMKKDVIYRVLNNEKIPWRQLLYGVVKRFQTLVNPEKQVADNSAFIIDDTADIRVGRKIENISWVHDHTDHKTKFGFKHLFLGFFDGMSFIPIDFSVHSEKPLSLKQRKEQFQKEVKKGSNGDRRRKEVKVDKITNALLMLKRAVKKGFKAKYVLADSWFSSKKFIQTIRAVKHGAMHVICGIKNDKRKYEYNGKQLNAKQLQGAFKQEGHAKRSRRWNTRYYEVVVHYDGIGMVKLYICRFPYQKRWRIFLSTDTSVTFAQMMEIYSIRWTIEVFFREAKQQLGLGKCKSRDFDAQIASITIVCILYTLLAYYRRANDYETLGGLFAVIQDDVCQKNLAQRLWELFDELLQVVITIISESGTVDITLFRESTEYQYIKSLFEESFLSSQFKKLNNAA